MADTVIPPFLNRLGYMLLAEVDSLHQVEDQLWLLHSTLTRLMPFLKEITIVERKQNDEDLVEEKEENSDKAMEVIGLVHDAEIITGKYLYNIHREGKFSSSSMDHEKVAKFRSEIKGMIQRLKGLHAWFFGFKGSTIPTSSSSSSSSKRPSPSPSAIEDGRDGDDDAVVVREDEVTRLIDMLIKDEDHAGRCDVIPVVGPRGLGKTTFVRKVYDHPIIVNHFPCRSWINVSNDYKVEELLQDILKQIIKDNPTTTAGAEEMRREMKKKKKQQLIIKELALETYKHLKNCSTRYLIVFDDVCDVNFWADIEMIFPAKNKSGSRIILITPHDEVASHARPSRPPFYLRRLSKVESRVLCSKRANLNVEVMNVLRQKYGEDVGADGCVGLPPAIIELAAALRRKFLGRSPATIKSDIEESIRSRNEIQYGFLDPSFFKDIISEKIVELIYNGLPNHLRKCLAYINLKYRLRLPETPDPYFDYIGLMVAEGLVKSPPGPPPTTSSPAAATAIQLVEDVADEYLNELINMNFIKIRRKSFDGRIKEVTIPKPHDSLSDRLRFKVAQFSKIKRSAAAAPTSKTMSSNMRNYFECLGIACPEDLSHRVLDLKIESSSPYFIFISLIHLRYLRLESNYNEDDDGSLEPLSTLCNLQFLKIKVVSWPGESLSCNLRLPFWKMRQLRHLSCSLKKSAFRLKSETRSTYLVLDPQLVLNAANGNGSIATLNNLQTLESLDTQFYVEGSSSRTTTEDSVWSSMMPNLVTLRVQGDIQYRIARGFPLLGRLRKLKLIGTEYKSSSSSSSSNNLGIFPPNITHLSLQDTQFNGAYLMRLVQKLQNLCSLKLKRGCINTDESKVLDFGQSDINDDGLFCQLKFLKLKEIDIKKWKMSEAVMPSLQKVAVSSCQELEGLPIEALEAIPTLQELKVDGKTSEGVSRDATLIIDGLKLRTGLVTGPVDREQDRNKGQRSQIQF